MAKLRDPVRPGWKEKKPTRRWSARQPRIVPGRGTTQARWRTQAGRGYGHAWWKS